MFDTKEERLAYGFEAEIAVKNYFEERGFKLTHNTVTAPEGTEKYWNEVKMNLTAGDLMLMNKEGDRSLFRADVKRGALFSKTTLTGFRGQFYFVVPNGDISRIEDTRVIWRRTVVNYINNATNGWEKNYVELRPGEYGYRLSKKLRLEMPLSEFVMRLTKRLISHPDEFEMPTPDFYKTFFVGEIEGDYV